MPCTGRIRQLAQSKPSERSLLDLRTVSADVLLLARGESSARQVTIRTEQSEELLPVFGDRVQLQQVLLNLVVNGIIKTMKLIVIGGTGLIGTKVVKGLREKGHEVVAASPSQGINSVTGEGLAEALVGAQVVVDVSNSPSWEDKAVLEFFETSERNLAAAEAAAGVGHHVALSVVGTERLLASGYFRAKMAQENLIKASSIPYTIVRATQFFEFVGGIAQGGHRRTDRPGSRGYDAAYRIGRCRRRRGRCGPCGAVEQHDRAGWSRTDPSRRAGSAIPECNRGPTDDNHRSQSPVFRRGNQ